MIEHDVSGGSRDASLCRERLSGLARCADGAHGTLSARMESPRAIALSLKRSAESSRRRKSAPFRSAMSMLNFHINRSGRSLSPERRRVLDRAKQELRAAFGRS